MQLIARDLCTICYGVTKEPIVVRFQAPAAVWFRPTLFWVSNYQSTSHYILEERRPHEPNVLPTAYSDISQYFQNKQRLFS